MRRRRRDILWLSVLLLTAGVKPSGAATRAADTVRGDWYFRESLAAIRDWESALALWEKATPEAQRTPVFPVPANGDAAEWPNPIPRMLLPDEDKGARVRVRKNKGPAKNAKSEMPNGKSEMGNGKWEVQRVAPDGTVASETIAPG